MDLMNELDSEKGPFSKGIPTEELYSNGNREEIIARLKYTAEHHGFAVLTAPPGCGKSTILRKLSSLLDKDKYIFIYVSDSKLTPRWLYNDILAQLGLDPYFYRGDGKKMVHAQIKYIEQTSGRHLVVCIDEAHLLSKETIEEIRFMLNTDMDSTSPLALILAGQHELKEKLRSPKFYAVCQRIDMVCSVDSLDELETRNYIQKHLDLIGHRTEDLFTPEALRRIFEKSQGTPRIINFICGKALTQASLIGAEKVTDDIVKAVIETELI